VPASGGITSRNDRDELANAVREMLEPRPRIHRYLIITNALYDPIRRLKSPHKDDDQGITQGHGYHLRSRTNCGLFKIVGHGEKCASEHRQSCLCKFCDRKTTVSGESRA
jgi:hypothetical protein